MKTPLSVWVSYSTTGKASKRSAFILSRKTPLIAPYQLGLWLAEYLSVRCQLCRLYPSRPQAWLASDSVTSPASPSPAMQPASQIHKLSRYLQSGLLCSSCHHSIEWQPELFSIDIHTDTLLPIQAATYYDYPMRQAIHSFKHSEDMTKLPLLVHALRQLSRPHGCHATNSVIVPMPTTNQRLVKRGFDPVTILSTQLSKHWQIPLWRGVQRIDNTVSQRGLSRAERLRNLDDAFVMAARPPVKRLLLFDDVATTGASLQALGRTLHQALAPIAVESAKPSLFETSQQTRYQIKAYALAHGSQ